MVCSTLKINMLQVKLCKLKPQKHDVCKWLELLTHVGDNDQLQCKLATIQYFASTLATMLHQRPLHAIIAPAWSQLNKCSARIHHGTNMEQVLILCEVTLSGISQGSTEGTSVFCEPTGDNPRWQIFKFRMTLDAQFWMCCNSWHPEDHSIINRE